jgi:hypothetical protein
MPTTTNNPARGSGAVGSDESVRSDSEQANHNRDENQNHGAFDLDQARRFLRLLDPDPSAHVFQTIDDNHERDDDRLKNTLHGSLDRRLDDLMELNSRGAGIFVTINKVIPGRRRRQAEDITDIRSVFVDLDGSPLEPVMAHHIKPHIVNLTSPGKYHVYWLVDALPLEHFEAVQLALAEKFRGDPVVCDLPRVMRLPGFFHCKREPHLVRIVRTIDTSAYPAEIFERKPMEPHISGVQGPVTDLDIVKAIAALEAIPPENDWKDRNYIGMAMWRATAGSREGFEAWCEWLARSGRYDRTQAERQWIKKYTRNLENGRKQPVGLGTLILYADTADPEWRDRLIFDLLNAEAV